MQASLTCGGASDLGVKLSVTLFCTMPYQMCEPVCCERLVICEYVRSPFTARHILTLGFRRLMVASISKAGRVIDFVTVLSALLSWSCSSSHSYSSWSRFFHSPSSTHCLTKSGRAFLLFIPPAICINHELTIYIV